MNSSDKKKEKTKTLKKKLLLKLNQNANISKESIKVNKHLKEMKKVKKIKKLIIVDNLNPNYNTTLMKKKIKRFNEEFIDILSELTDIMVSKGDPFRAKAYRDAVEVIIKYDGDINTVNQLEGKKGIGKTMLTKLNEYIETGTLQILEKERKNPITVLTKVHGIGPKKAKQLVDIGIESIDDLKKNQTKNEIDELLTDNIKLGIKYFDDIEKRIPREEIKKYKSIFDNLFNENTSLVDTQFDIVGSYRRGNKTSGDIDIIITNNKNNKEIFKNVIDILIEKKIIIEVLSLGKVKSLTICKLPNETPRRVDFLYSPPDEYYFALLYFTGSKVFNTLQRQRALDLGYTLNEHGLHKINKGVKGDKVNQKFTSEKSIFDFLEMEYCPPEKRNDTLCIKKLDKKDDDKKEDDKKEDDKKSFSELSETELSSLIKEANDEYYCNNESIMSDDEYDLLIEYMKNKYPNNKVIDEGHTACAITKNKVTLPYEMWSMDKIKPNSKSLSNWISKYSGPYVLSCKLDGVSGLYTSEGSVPKLYTRGNGKIGQDVSHLIPYLKLPKTKNIVLRGEFIVSKKLFEEKYNSFSNSRNFVAGVINQKKIEINKFKDVDFVIYEVIKPILKPYEQLVYVNKEIKGEYPDINIVRYAKSDKISEKMLSKLLLKWKDNYKYEIDGIICADNNIYERGNSNPEHAFAFKMIISDQIVETKVVDVIWTPSKDGYLKPRVKIEPVTLGGAKIEYATGFNAKFIKDNKIGIGSIIKIIRSGDVIPHITDVVKSSETPKMPDVEYIWNSTNIDIILENKSDDKIVQQKNISGFFTIIGVEGLGPGNIKKVYTAGYDTIPKIIKMKKDDFMSVEGFKDKLSDKIHIGIQDKIQNVSLPELMQATNIFGRGFGERRFKTILTSYPDIFNDFKSQKNNVEIIEKLNQINGMASKTSQNFINKLPEFISWIKETNLENKLIINKKDNKRDTKDKKHPLYGKKYVLTGFRDNKLVDKLDSIGAEQSNTVTKNTFLVIVESYDEDTGKVSKAKELNIKIITPNDLIQLYFTK
jgi:NAD-dependent DNA ligase/DNA polymerase/3'-5' exonuclease PolX